MCRPRIDCRDCFWYEEGNSDFWCGYHKIVCEEYEPCEAYVENVEFTATHDITVGKGGEITVKPNDGEEEYFKNRG